MIFYTYTGREIAWDAVRRVLSCGGLVVPERELCNGSGRARQMRRMIAKARRRANRLVPWDRPVRFKSSKGSFIFRRGQVFVRAGDIEEVERGR